MTRLEMTAAWILAIFLTIISYVGMFFLSLFAFLKLQGLPFGTQPPPDFESPPLNPTLFGLLLDSMIVLPLMVASYVGVITAPKPQRNIACFVFPLSLFLVENIALLSGKNHQISMRILIETGGGGAVVGAFLYFRWRRQKARKAGAEG
jgi:hypothetical protein